MTAEGWWPDGTKRRFKEALLHLNGQEPDQDHGISGIDNVRITICGDGRLAVGHRRSPRNSRGNLRRQGLGRKRNIE